MDLYAEAWEMCNNLAFCLFVFFFICFNLCVYFLCFFCLLVRATPMHYAFESMTNFP